MTVTPPPSRLRLTKGHGTENDFLLLADPHGEVAVDADLVVALCDRRAGVGADGLIRAVRNAAMGGVALEGRPDVWFMDYYNADGSIAEMCGNGVRVFARFLVVEGLVDPDKPLDIATRGGLRTVCFEAGGQVTVAMGRAQLLEGEVEVATESGTWPATGVHLPNPHAVAFVPDPAGVGRLTEPPRVTPAAAFPDGVNVEFVQVVGPGHLSLRVHERGVGETRSCGTGICAAAVVAADHARGGGTGVGQDVDEWRVDVPGGTTRVRLLPGGNVELTGPAVLVATVDVDLASLRSGRIRAS